MGKGDESVEQRDEHEGDALAVFFDGTRLRGGFFLLALLFAALLFRLGLRALPAGQHADAELRKKEVERGDQQRGQNREQGCQFHGKPSFAASRPGLSAGARDLIG